MYKHNKKSITYVVLSVVAAVLLFVFATIFYAGSQVVLAAEDCDIIAHDSELSGNTDSFEKLEKLIKPEKFEKTNEAEKSEDINDTPKEFIKWIDLNVDSKSLGAALKLCKEYRGKGINLEFSEVLAHLAIKNSNKFTYDSTQKTLKRLRAHIDGGGTVSGIHADGKYYKYYVDSYHAVFDGIVGEYTIGGTDEVSYGIKGFFPIAQGFWYNHYDDFGSKRAYGYKRRHLGHDFMGSVGTPIIAIEGGVVTELGWNRYGGWRVGIRSDDAKRYYYYAHLRKDKPYPSGLEIGDTVVAGQVIGFLGHTGYSTTENVNLKSGKPHLHLGLQIIFDKSQEKGSKEIWVDLLAISNFLSGERAKVERNAETKEWESKSVKLARI